METIKMSANKTETMTIRIPPAVKQLASEQAKKNTRSLIGQIVHYVKLGLVADGVKNDELENLDALRSK
jgi:hypothetical protein